MPLSDLSLGKHILNSKAFSKGINDPVWDWATQRWKGTIIRKNGCNYYDLSNLRPNLLQELREPLIAGLQGDLGLMKQVIKDIDEGLELKHGDLIQTGKTKNRNLFLISTKRILPITQLLGGNGFGEIPLTYIFDLEEVGLLDEYRTDYWTFRNHPIINHLPYLPLDKHQWKNDFCQNIKISGRIFTITEGSDFLNHPYIYLDFENNEYFTLPASIKQRFEAEIDRMNESFTSDSNLLIKIQIKEMKNHKLLNIKINKE